MFKQILNKLIDSGGLWFAAMMVHIISALVTSMVISLVGVIIDWFGKNT